MYAHGAKKAGLGYRVKEVPQHRTWQGRMMQEANLFLFGPSSAAMRNLCRVHDNPGGYLRVQSNTHFRLTLIWAVQMKEGSNSLLTASVHLYQQVKLS